MRSGPCEPQSRNHNEQLLYRGPVEHEFVGTRVLDNMHHEEGVL